ncbi:Uu.00g057600.m01.CDS01 [Anthostomella pinea]|uniref:Uu.00g057600.m01.CDS01 n=1 Tax=Anthostomella pinea TaxID=933095 RepID=A0AAI8YMB1_9PEZI|nr:Uu.00g057600.m01.CDS01 [Anthostomella pinea]
MDAMDVDEGGPSRRLALIRTVRTLDDDKELPLPDKIHKLWLLLSETKHTRLHGVEESILRWLLKQMNGNSETAELARRYPLTWTILGHVFPKVPAQTLGRSLTYLKFVSILKKTLDEVTAATTEVQANGVASDGEGAGSAKKRKRDNAIPSSIEELRTPEGCVKSAMGIFGALANLLEQGTSFSSALAPEKRVGAEHIKSLFSSSSDETRDITVRLLLICDHSISFVEQGFVRDHESWIDILTTIWNLRPHNKEDNTEFARLLYAPTCSILAKLKGISGAAPELTNSTVRDLWVRQLEKFLSTFSIRPARQRFAVDANVDTLSIALAFAKRDPVASTTVMWDVAARTPRDTNEPKSRMEHTSWAEAVFELLLGALDSLQPAERNQVVSRLLDTALETGSIPNTPTLRTLCKAHALVSDDPDWTLVSKITACDADVFLMDNSLSEDIFDRISAASSRDSETRDKIITKVTLPLQRAFANARDLAGFVTRWYGCLCKYATAPGSSMDQAIWFDSRIRQVLASMLQSALSSTQLLRLLERLDSPGANSGALLVILDGVCAGLTDESFISSADSKIFSMTFPGKSYDNVSSQVLSLRWRVAGYMASWETSEECYQLWAEIKPVLKKILKKGSFDGAETFEAFACCYKLCLANHIGGKYEEELVKLTCSFLERLITAVKTSDSPLEFRHFLDFVFCHLPKLAEQPKQEVNTLSDLIVGLFWYTSQQLAAKDDSQLRAVIRPLLQNFDVEDEEPFLDALMAQPLDALDSAEVQCGWAQPHSLSVILVLLEFPREAWTKGRRKRIMSSCKKWKLAIDTHASQNRVYGASVLRLLVKIMQQPTFYEGMDFNDLVDICSQIPSQDYGLLALVERLIELTLRQMVVNAEDASMAYLRDASRYVGDLYTKTASGETAQILLVIKLVSVLSNSPSTKSYSTAVDLGKIRRKLVELVQYGLSDFAKESEALSTATKEDPKLVPLSVILAAAATLTEIREGSTIELSDKVTRKLETASLTFVSRGVDICWKLRAFLVRRFPNRYDNTSFCSQLEQGTSAVDEDLVYDFVDAFVKGKGQAAHNLLFGELTSNGRLATGPIGPLLAAKKLLELHQGASTSQSQSDKGLDLGAVHAQFASLLSRVESLRHFKQVSEILLFLLDKHANSMTQFNIEVTLSSVADVCSLKGPCIQGPRAAGEIYEFLYKLVALVIKRHRLRLRGHFPILIAALRALLYTLLADPGSHAIGRRSLPTHPPWLGSRLEARHAERFARLLTLICEPSAASVARGRSSELDSATDAAKRAAGQDMFIVVELYIKLQLEGAGVPHDMRKVVERGIYSVLDVTPTGARRVLNESLDAGGRAVFRLLFADYKKFGKWSGV